MNASKAACTISHLLARHVDFIRLHLDEEEMDQYPDEEEEDEEGDKGKEDEVGKEDTDTGNPNSEAVCIAKELKMLAISVSNKAFFKYGEKFASGVKLDADNFVLLDTVPVLDTNKVTKAFARATICEDANAFCTADPGTATLTVTLTGNF